MLNIKTHNKYFEVNHDDGFNVPLKHTSFDSKYYIALKKGDVIYVTSEGMCFIGIDNGKDKFIKEKWLYFNDEQLYVNSDLPGVMRHKNKPPLFVDVTTKINRSKNLKKLLGN